MKNLNKKLSGLTMLETLIAVTISIAVGVSIFTFFAKNMAESKKIDSATQQLSEVMSAFIKRADIEDGVKDNDSKEYKTTNELGSFTKLFNGKNTSCGSWNPETPDENLNERLTYESALSCNTLSKDIMKSEKVGIIDKVNNSYELRLNFKNSDITNNLPLLSKVAINLSTSNELSAKGNKYFGFTDKITNKPISSAECSSNPASCAFSIKYSIDNTSEDQYLSIFGDNMQVGKIKFTNGILNPQICRKWAIEDGEIKSQEDVYCGIENEDGKISFKLNDIETESITVNSTCQMLETDKNYNIIGTDDAVFPCGIYRVQRETETNRQLLISSISEIFNAELARANKTSSLTNSSNVSETKMHSVGNTVTTENAISEALVASSAFNAVNVKVDHIQANSTYIQNFKTSENDNIIRNLKSEVTEISGVNLTNRLEVKNLRTETTDSYGMTIDGDLEVSGNLNADTVDVVGVLRSDTILNPSKTKNTKIESSAFLNSYAELNGVKNNKKSGITGVRETNTTGNIIVDSTVASRDNLAIDAGGILVNRANDPSIIEKSFVVKGSKGGNFIDIRNGNISLTSSNIANGYLNGSSATGRGFVRIDGSANIANQVYGDVIVRNNNTPYYVYYDDRFLNVIDTTPTIPKYSLDKLSTKPASSPITNYQENTLTSATLRGAAISSSLSRSQSLLNSARNAILSSVPPKGAKGLQGVQGDKGIRGDKGDTGAMGEQGPMGDPYDSEAYIWLPLDQSNPVTCENESSINRKGIPNLSQWEYHDVIEGNCMTKEEAEISEEPIHKYFMNTTDACSSVDSRGVSFNGFRTEIFQCKKAKYRLEPYALNAMPKYSVCNVESEAPAVKEPVFDNVEFEAPEGEAPAVEEPAFDDVEFEAPEIEATESERFENLRELFEQNTIGIRSSEFYSDCIEDGRYYTTLTNIENKPKTSLMISLDDFENFVMNDVEPSGINAEICTNERVLQISRCEYSGAKESDYVTHPKGFLESIGR